MVGLIRYPVCQMCGREVRWPGLQIFGPYFCMEHRRAYRKRWREGVATSELDSSWGDALDNWRERPGELDGERGRRKRASKLYFVKRVGEWVLFSRSFVMAPSVQDWNDILYRVLTGRQRDRSVAVLRSDQPGRTSKAFFSRMPDYLAVHVGTGEVRRFVDVNQDEVEAELEGRGTVPLQEEAVQYWGRYEATGMRERELARFYGQVHEGSRLLLDRFIVGLAFPVFGPLEKSYGLMLSSAGYSGSGSYMISVSGCTLAFDREPVRDMQRPALRLHMSAPERWKRRELDDLLVRHQNRSIFRRHGFDEWGVEDMETWEGEIEIDGYRLVGTIYAWSEPGLAHFIFRGEQSAVLGEVSGLGLGEVRELLAGLVDIRGRAELLEQYQREMDAYTGLGGEVLVVGVCIRYSMRFYGFRVD